MNSQPESDMKSINLATTVQSLLILMICWVLYELYEFNGSQKAMIQAMQDLTRVVQQMRTSMATQSEVNDLKANMEDDIREMRTQVSGAHGRMSSHDERLRKLEIGFGRIQP